MRVALHTEVRADRVAEYEAAHPEVPVELTDAIRAAGATAWLRAELEKLPVNVAWQARMAELLDVVHDYSGEGADAGLPVVWELP
ncbi:MULTISPECIES: L-rhamnose mutarotase [unclassified Streptomyces]|uniref:L-rhamnose mutarotase n=1 Tax=unclassified Streptomyces TaxID=2593676 RepID=UPI002366703D|nr:MULTISPECIES: L-rhamnose mutarotase [unclassified Streptomyces]MDF3144339.1 L-rhamnose mutarotase [Streptomyces sp. T21Q-yed]WDF43208.1 L-rhamnose mutarotase [Streptomyces sp. T12]